MPYDYYIDPCGPQVEDPECDQCGDDIELGRLRSGAFLHKSALGSVLANPTSNAPWDAAKAAGKLKVLANVRGLFDGGTPVETDGFGDQATKVIGYDYVASMKDPVYKKNANFWESLLGRTDWYFVFRTETATHISGNPVSIAPKNPVEEDSNSQVVWDVELKWRQKTLVKPFDTPPAVFDCSNPPGSYYTDAPA